MQIIVVVNMKDVKNNLAGFPGGSDGKESACNAGDPGSIPGLGRSSGERNGYPLQYSCLEKFMGRGAWWATVHEVTKELGMTERLNKNKQNKNSRGSISSTTLSISSFYDFSHSNEYQLLFYCGFHFHFPDD